MQFVSKLCQNVTFLCYFLTYLFFV